MVRYSLLLVILSFFAFFPGLGGDFVWDDDLLLLDHPNYRHPELILSSLKSLFLISPSYFRPIGYLSFFADYALFGTSSTFYHLENLLLHICCVLLLFRLLLAMGGRPLAACLGAAVFAIHPSRVEGVVFISSRFDLLTTLFFLGAIRIHHRSLTGRSWKLRWVAALVFLFALLSKEMAITFPVVALIADRMLWPPPRPKPSRRARRAQISWTGLKSYTPYLVAIGFYLLARTATLGALLPTRAGPPVVAGLLHRLLLVGRTYAGYVGFTIFPFFPSPVHYYPAAGAADLQGWFGLLLLVGSVYLIRRGRLERTARSGLFLFVVLLLPVLNLIPIRLAGPSYFAERFLYLPLVGLAIVLTWLFSHLPKKRTTFVLVGIVLLSFLFVSYTASGKWRNDRTLFAWVVHRTPQSALGYTNLSLEETRGGSTELALAFSESALVRQPNNADAWDNIGVAYFQAGALAKAESCFIRALALAPGHPLFRTNLAGTWRTMGRLDESLRLLQEVLQQDSTTTSAHLNIGLCHLQAGRPTNAIRPLERAADLGEVDPSIWMTLAKAYVLVGRDIDAREAIQRAAALKMSGDSIVEELAVAGRSALQERRVRDSARLLQAAGALSPEDPVIVNDLGVSLRALGQIDGAESCFAQAVHLAPDLSVAHANLGEIALLAGESARAESILRGTIARWPELPDAYRHIGHLFLQQGKTDSARGFFERYLVLAPDGFFAPEITTILEKHLSIAPNR